VKEQFAKRLTAAISEVGAAEQDLAELLPRIRMAPRAEKTTITKAVETALTRLRLARADLLDLQELLSADDP
jgi:hypothetical protein